MSALSEDCARAGGLISLSSFTFTTHPNCLTTKWMDSTLSLLKDSPLESIQINSTERFEGLVVTFGNVLCMQIVDQHRDRLIHFSLHGLQLSIPFINYICLHCTRLEQLFICVDHSITDMVCLPFFGSRTYADVQVARHPLRRYLYGRSICVQYISNSMTSQSSATPTSTR